MSDWGLHRISWPVEEAGNLLSDVFVEKKNSCA